jgi:hypothetical protein
LNCSDDHVGGVVAAIDPEQRDEAAGEQSRPDEQHRRQRDLPDGETRANGARARPGGRRPPAFLQCFAEIAAGDPDGGKSAGQHGGNDGGNRREDHQASIDRKSIDARDVARAERADEIERPRRGEHA